MGTTTATDGQVRSVLNCFDYTYTNDIIAKKPSTEVEGIKSLSASLISHCHPDTLVTVAEKRVRVPS